MKLPDFYRVSRLKWIALFFTQSDVLSLRNSILREINMKNTKIEFLALLTSILVITLIIGNFSFADMHGGMMGGSSDKGHMGHGHMEGHSKDMHHENMDHDMDRNMDHGDMDHKDMNHGNMNHKDMHRGDKDHDGHSSRDSNQ